MKICISGQGYVADLLRELTRTVPPFELAEDVGSRPQFTIEIDATSTWSRIRVDTPDGPFEQALFAELRARCRRHEAAQGLGRLELEAEGGNLDPRCLSIAVPEQTLTEEQLEHLAHAIWISLCTVAGQGQPRQPWWRRILNAGLELGLEQLLAWVRRRGLKTHIGYVLLACLLGASAAAAQTSRVTQGAQGSTSSPWYVVCVNPSTSLVESCAGAGGGGGGSVTQGTTPWVVSGTVVADPSADVTANATLSGGGQAVTLALSGRRVLGVKFDPSVGALNGTLFVSVSLDGGTTYQANIPFVDLNEYKTRTSWVAAGGSTIFNWGVLLPPGTTHARVTLNPYTSGSAVLTLRANGTGDFGATLYSASVNSLVPPQVALIGGDNGSGSVLRAFFTTSTANRTQTGLVVKNIAQDVDDTAFSAANNTFQSIGGVYNDGLTALSTGRMATFRMTPNRGQHVNLRDQNGTELGGTGAPLAIRCRTADNSAYESCAGAGGGAGGTQYTQSASSASPTGTLAMGYDYAGQLVKALSLTGTAHLEVATDASNDTIGAHLADGFGSSLTSDTTAPIGTERGLHVRQVGALPAGTNKIGSVAISQTTTDNDVDVLTLPSVTVGTFPDNEPFNLAQIGGAAAVNGGVAGSVAVGGTQANNAAITDNPVLIGGEAVAPHGSQPAAATSGNIRRALLTTDGRAFVAPHGPVTFTCGLNALAATLTQCVAVAAAGLRHHITSVHVQTTTTTSGTYAVQTGTGTNCGTGTAALFPVSGTANRFNAPASTSGPAFHQFLTPLVAPAGAAICVIGVATNTISIQIVGYTAP